MSSLCGDRRAPHGRRVLAQRASACEWRGTRGADRAHASTIGAKATPLAFAQRLTGLSGGMDRHFVARARLAVRSPQSTPLPRRRAHSTPRLTLPRARPPSRANHACRADVALVVLHLVSRVARAPSRPSCRRACAPAVTARASIASRGVTGFQGVAFPTCVSVNECVCHNSPLESDAQPPLAEGDVVKVRHCHGARCHHASPGQDRRWGCHPRTFPKSPASSRGDCLLGCSPSPHTPPSERGRWRPHDAHPRTLSPLSNGTVNAAHPTARSIARARPSARAALPAGDDG